MKSGRDLGQAMQEMQRWLFHSDHLTVNEENCCAKCKKNYNTERCKEKGEGRIASIEKRVLRRADVQVGHI